MDSIFTNVLQFLIGFLLFVPYTALNLVGLLLPSCSSLSIIGSWNEAVIGFGNMILVLWPILKWVPWEGVWNLISAMILYELVRPILVGWTKPEVMIHLGWPVWAFIAILYVVSASISLFTGFDFLDSPAFTEVFGTASSVNSGVGSGFGGGGGGGGSW